MKKPEKRAGEIELGKIRGIGGYADVYEAKMRATERDSWTKVAVKRFRTILENDHKFAMVVFLSNSHDQTVDTLCGAVFEKRGADLEDSRSQECLVFLGHDRDRWYSVHSVGVDGERYDGNIPRESYRRQHTCIGASQY